MEIVIILILLTIVLWQQKRYNILKAKLDKLNNKFVKYLAKLDRKLEKEFINKT